MDALHLNRKDSRTHPVRVEPRWFEKRSFPRPFGGERNRAGLLPFHSVLKALTSHFPLRTFFCPLTTHHSPLTNLSTLPAPVPYSLPFRFIEGVLRRRSGAEAE